MIRFKMADLCIGLDCGEFMLETDNLIEPFLADDNAEPDFVFAIKLMEPEIFADAICLKKTGGFELLEVDGRRFLMNHWAKCRFGYGFWLDELNTNREIPVYFNKSMHDQIVLSVSRFFSTIGLHDRLLMAESPIVHASYIDYNGKGIIFTAPAGTGKSTQADLWAEFAGAEVINGDRVLLGKRNGVWKAFGYPCCGSSYICVNRALPLAAIVVLEQGSENTVTQLTALQKIRALVSATEVYIWNTAEIDKAFEIAGNIINDIPVIKLSCRPDEDAVRVLQGFLEESIYE